MGEFDIRGHYSRLLSEDTTKSMPIAAMESLAALCDASKANTIHELLSSIETGSNALIDSVPNSISLTAGCAMFTKFISSHTHDDPRDFEAFKKKLQENGHLFAQSAREARFKIAEIGLKMVRDGITIMVHGYSRCAVGILTLAAEKGIRFQVIVTETRPSCQGLKVAKELRNLGVPVAVIDDNAVAYAMKKCKCILIGAESIFTDASIINIVSFTLSPRGPIEDCSLLTLHRWEPIKWPLPHANTTVKSTSRLRRINLSTYFPWTSSTFQLNRT